MKNLFTLLLLALSAPSAFAQLPDTVEFQLCARYWKDDRPIKGATLTFQAINPAFPYSPIVINLDTSQSCTNLVVVISDYLPGTTFSYSASLPDTGHLNGVTVVDICKTSRHILGIEPLSSPYSMIAADVNKSGSITTFDLVESNKLITGVYNSIPNNTAWRFIPDYCIFPNPNNPFQSSCIAGISDVALAMLDGGIAKVIGTKTGDVDGDVTLIGESFTQPVGTDSITLLLPQIQVTAGVPVVVPVRFDKAIQFATMQAQFFLDPALAHYDSISDGLIDVYPPSNVNYNQQTGELRFSTGGAYLNIFATSGATLFNIHLTPSQSGNLSDVLKVVLDDPTMSTLAVGSDCTLHFTIGSTYVNLVDTHNPISTGVRVLPPSPNPFREQTWIEIELENAETAVLELADLTGRLLLSEQKILHSGTNRWEIEASTIAPGSFAIWRLRVGGQMVSGKLVRE